jgi:hypothetical protein
MIGYFLELPRAAYREAMLLIAALLNKDLFV